jgi:hypothetical protein
LGDPLDRVADVAGGEDGGGQLVPAVAGNEETSGWLIQISSATTPRTARIAACADVRS